MSWRFRRSVRLAPGVRLTISKRGLGVSVGRRGLHVGVGPRGPYISAGIPGTGLYDIEYLGKEHPPQQREPAGQGQPTVAATGGCCGCLLALLTGALLVCMAAILVTPH